MRKILKLSVSEFRMLKVYFDDETIGTIRIDETFTGVSQSLNNPHIFASAKIIDDGYGVGFDGCEYDICANWLYEKTITSLSADVGSNLKCAEDRSDYRS